VRQVATADIIQAVREEEAFHIYAVRTVDEGLDLLSKREAGQIAPDGRYPDAKPVPPTA
jgi:hypothetical protein